MLLQRIPLVAAFCEGSPIDLIEAVHMFLQGLLLFFARFVAVPSDLELRGAPMSKVCKICARRRFSRRTRLKRSTPKKKKIHRRSMKSRGKSRPTGGRCQRPEASMLPSRRSDESMPTHLRANETFRVSQNALRADRPEEVERKGKWFRRLAAAPAAVAVGVGLEPKTSAMTRTWSAW